MISQEERAHGVTPGSHPSYVDRIADQQAVSCSFSVAYRIWRSRMSEQVTYELLKGFLEAFNRHDLDAVMSYFAEDCVFYMPRGAAPRGDRYVGKTEVRAGLAKRFEGIPDVHYGEDRHWVCDDFGVSEWTLTGTSVSGQK